MTRYVEIPVADVLGFSILAAVLLLLAVLIAVAVTRYFTCSWYEHNWHAFVEWQIRDTFRDLRDQVTRAGRRIRQLEDENGQYRAKVDMARGALESGWTVEQAVKEQAE